MINRSYIIISCIILVVLLTLASALFTWRIIFGPYEQAVISGETEIGTQWKEIRPSVPLVVEKEKQFVAIEVEPPYSAWKGLGISLPSGEVINPEIKLISTEGIEYDLKYFESTKDGGLLRNVEYAEYVHENGFPKSTMIGKVLLRSKDPIRVKRIFWSGFNWKERP